MLERLSVIRGPDGQIARIRYVLQWRLRLAPLPRALRE